MKKIVLFCLILAAIPIIVISGSSKSQNRYNYYPNLPKDDKWEYVKERVFDGETEKVNKYSGPILVELINASKLDSVALENNFDELRTLIPNKEINYFRNFTGIPKVNPNLHRNEKIKGYEYSDLWAVSISIYITEVDSLQDAYSLEDKRFLKAVKPNGIFFSPMNKDRPSGFSGSKITFKFHKSQTVEERQDIIRFYLVRMISCASLFKERINGKFDIKGAMLNRNEATSWHLDFTDYDKFLLQKLYSPTLVKEYKDYMYSTYPWRFAGNFINKEKQKILANWIASFSVFIMLFLGFNILYKRTYKFLYLSYFFPVVVAFICFYYASFIHSYLITTGNHFQFRTYYLTCLSYILIGAVLAFCLMFYDRYINKFNWNFTKEFVFKICFTLIAVLVPIFIIFIAENKFVDWFFRLNTFLAFAFLFSIVRGIFIYLDHFSENLIKQKDIELSQLKALNAQAEVKLLQSQINPHFLYNALNSIASLAQTDASKTEKMALSLSDLFKYTINRKGKKKNAISDEVEMVKTYLEVEQIRFGDRLSYKVQVDESLNDIEIPMFLIQPLIENAVKHGISKIEGAGEIQLKISKNKEGIDIIVTDNGPQFPDGFVSGHGLQTVYDLLKFSYADNASINIVNEPVKQITITIKTKF
ncbi:sensor histidine kinase [Mariniflexile gromovii]|uniref:Histidine kinase n=1 Tax=Mariniflexile gromovii TaxID=362523 RepID=A0ABS4BV50_9FLAO|nr:histidine kinase [Mariniflexile gromovii]MBP0904469.1 histidine kinase [Mariniflexile gromovii]